MKRIDHYMKMPDGKERRIRLLIPEMEDQAIKVPVLYMFDGQNLFEEEDAYGGVTWGIQEVMEKLMLQKGALPMAVVGIDNAEERRLDEYGPWPFTVNEHSSLGEGAIFAEYFMNNVLKELEETYPLLRGGKNRALAGSSMGGLMTAYIGAKYPDEVHQLGIFSLASWVSEEPFLKEMEEASFHGKRIYLQVGTEEQRDQETGQVDYALSQMYLDHSLRFLRVAIQRGADLKALRVNIGAGKTHHEAAWASYMEEFLSWVQEGFSREEKVQ